MVFLCQKKKTESVVASTTKPVIKVSAGTAFNVKTATDLKNATATSTATTTVGKVSDFKSASQQ